MSPLHSGRGAARRGATRRRKPLRLTVGGFDCWLDRAVEIAVFTALAVGSVALVLTLLH